MSAIWDSWIKAPLNEFEVEIDLLSIATSLKKSESLDLLFDDVLLGESSINNLIEKWLIMQTKHIERY